VLPPGGQTCTKFKIAFAVPCDISVGGGGAGVRVVGGRWG